MQKFVISSAIVLLFALFLTETTSTPIIELPSKTKVSDLPVVATVTEGVGVIKEEWTADDLANNEKIENANKICLDIGEHCAYAGDCCTKRCLSYSGKCVS